MIPCQRGDELVLAEAFSKLRPLKYLDRRRFAQVLSAFEAINQPNLETKALLRSWAFLKPRPPKDLGLQMESQAFGYKWCLESENPQNKSRSLASIWAQVFLGSWKEDIQ